MFNILGIKSMARLVTANVFSFELSGQWSNAIQKNHIIFKAELFTPSLTIFYNSKDKFAIKIVITKAMKVACDTLLFAQLHEIQPEPGFPGVALGGRHLYDNLPLLYQPKPGDLNHQQPLLFKL